MSWENILKKTDKPTKTVEIGGGRVSRWDEPFAGGRTHYSETHFDVCNKVTGKNRQFHEEEGEWNWETDAPEMVRYEIDNCNCRQIAKDWIGELPFVKDIIFDAGVGTVYDGESTVHSGDGTDWNKLIEEKGD